MHGIHFNCNRIFLIDLYNLLSSTCVCLSFITNRGVHYLAAYRMSPRDPMSFRSVVETIMRGFPSGQRSLAAVTSSRTDISRGFCDAMKINLENVLHLLFPIYFAFGLRIFKDELVFVGKTHCYG